MQITNSNNQDFTAIYKIPKTNIDTHLRIDNSIAQAYHTFKKAPIYYFSGDCPFDASVAKIIDDDIKQKNLSYEWIIQNAKNFGIKLPNPREIDVWVFTGEKDIQIVDEYTKHAEKICTPTLLEKAKIFLFGHNRNYDIPEHLDIYSDILGRLDRLKDKFNESIKNHKVIEVKDSTDLFIKLMNE